MASLARPAARPLSALGRWTEPVRVVVPPPARPAVPPPVPAQIPETLKMMGFPTGPVKPMPLPSPPVGSRSTDTLCHSPPVCLRGCMVCAATAAEADPGRLDRVGVLGVRGAEQERQEAEEGEPRQAAVLERAAEVQEEDAREEEMRVVVRVRKSNQACEGQCNSKSFFLLNHNMHCLSTAYMINSSRCSALSSRSCCVFSRGSPPSLTQSSSQGLHRPFSCC